MSREFSLEQWLMAREVEEEKSNMHEDFYKPNVDEGENDD